MPSEKTAPNAHNPVEIAIQVAKGVRPLARLIGIAAPSVWEWRQRGRVPAERVLQLEAVTGLSRHVLRPDLYPVDLPRRGRPAAVTTEPRPVRARSRAPHPKGAARAT
jgi:DNA-binding transcriptional regulator YdaS (Cro superfamily)